MASENGKAAELRAQLAVAELEEQLAKAKKTKAGPSRELKLKLREARATARAGRVPATEGEA